MSVTIYSTIDVQSAPVNDDDLDRRKKKRRSRPVALAGIVPWNHYRLSQCSETFGRLPVAGEILLWLVPSEFRLVSASNIGSWLTVAERKRTRIHPNSALARRFGVGRATLRLLLSGMLSCEKQDIEFEEGPEERIVVKGLEDDVSLDVDIAYSGIWIVIAVAAGRVGIKVSASLSTARDTHALFASARERAERGPMRALSAAAGGTSRVLWYTLPLLLPGEARGAVVSEDPIRLVKAFGWDRPFRAT